MFIFSLHSLEQLAKRGITKQVALWIIENATEKITQEDVTIYQSLFNENDKNYFVRIFVNETKTPALIITGYKTSKIQKY